MLGYVLRRIAATIPVMGVVAVIIFSLLYFSPTDPAAIIAGNTAMPKDVEAIRVHLGLDRPIYVQFGRWLWQILQGDLGRSIFSNQPVLQMIGQRVEPTISLALTTMVFAILLSVPLGMLAAARAGRLTDHLVMAFSVLGFSLPIFWFAYLLIATFSVGLGWLPVQGFRSLAEGPGPFLSHLILPTLALGPVYMALLTRMTRGSFLGTLQEDYIRTARAKGLSTVAVLVRHALRNAGIPILTTIGSGFAVLIGGVVITESVFAIPGIGRLTVDSVLRGDYPVIQGVMLVLSVVYVLINLAIDLLYTVVDPRIRY
jgi:peptide/nickel transport system permease protein